ncbi:hypothetical protein DFH06DRAFT_1149500 [Mycena polygramma]|nr:hypothetical protein DFH06DRAFT_1149500 [Mycena polygramma]
MFFVPKLWPIHTLTLLFLFSAQLDLISKGNPAQLNSFAHEESKPNSTQQQIEFQIECETQRRHECVAVQLVEEKKTFRSRLAVCGFGSSGAIHPPGPPATVHGEFEIRHSEEKLNRLVTLLLASTPKAFRRSRKCEEKLRYPPTIPEEGFEPRLLAIE